ncbi:MAG: hypothetical protein M3461_11455 [Pseudomonadota bacterium]|nr:hypothetical protein [Pseudomonadota bacterium]
MSFPRSGHTLLIRLLLAYFGSGFNYCEFYNGCRSWTCRRPLSNFQKCHDLRLDTPQRPDLRYIIQIRHPWPAIVSQFRLKLARCSVEDTMESWERHRRKQLPYYSGFVARWALAGQGLQRVLVPYHRLVDRPVDMFAEIARLFANKVDVDRVRWVVQESDVRERRRWADFPYTTDAALAEAEAINVLDLPLL